MKRGLNGGQLCYKPGIGKTDCNPVGQTYNTRNIGMPKALCITGMVISVLILLLFALDMILGMFEFSKGLAPFRGASFMMDVVFVICGLLLGYMSWTTFKEQK